jgi:hypothetical protein
LGKLIVTCNNCGREARVSPQALGKTGICPHCRKKSPITTDNTREDAEKTVQLRNPRPRGHRRPTPRQVDLFGKAVDLYQRGEHAEALSIFDRLTRELPGNPDVGYARMECLEALRRPRVSGSSENGADLTPDQVRRVVLDKMLHGRDEADELQLKAARLAAEMLGMVSPGGSVRGQGLDEGADEGKGAPPPSTEEAEDGGS